ncbi:MAG TPA: hypothetical protein VGK70_05320 [Thermoanaerobaculia bacterium]|jgi:hypothetical protein
MEVLHGWAVVAASKNITVTQDPKPKIVDASPSPGGPNMETI